MTNRHTGAAPSNDVAVNYCRHLMKKPRQGVTWRGFHLLASQCDRCSTTEPGKLYSSTPWMPYESDRRQVHSSLDGLKRMISITRHFRQKMVVPTIRCPIRCHIQE